MATGTEEQLAFEAARRPRMALAAFVSAVLTLGSGIVNGTLFSGAPRAGYVDALQRGAQPGPVSDLGSLRVPFYEFYDDRAFGLLATSLARALGLIGLGLVLTFLAAATRARRPELPKPALYLGLIGGILSALATLGSTVASVLAVRSFLDGTRTVGAAGDLASGSLLVFSQLLGFAGSLALGLGLVLVCLSAMRAGLLTRFMGVLGIIVGVLQVIPIGSPLPVVQCFWLFALGLLLLDRWPNGIPPAWKTGQAEPWPSQQAVRAARAAARSGGGAGDAGPGDGAHGRDEPAAVAVGASQASAPAASRKRRKRRD